MKQREDAAVIGCLKRDNAVVGYVALDTQLWSFSKRAGLRVRRWSENRRRYRLDLLDDRDEGFLDAQDEADLAAGRFRFKGEVLAYEELVGAEKNAVFLERFSEWD